MEGFGKQFTDANNSLSSDVEFCHGFAAFQVDTTSALTMATLQAPDSENNKLYLKPFSLKPRILFEAENINTILLRTIMIQNPENEVKFVEVEKLPSTKLGFFLKKTRFEIPPQSEYVLQMFWKPPEPGSWRDEIIFRDHKARKGGVILIFKTIKEAAGPISKPKPPTAAFNVWRQVHSFGVPKVKKQNVSRLVLHKTSASTNVVNNKSMVSLKPPTLVHKFKSPLKCPNSNIPLKFPANLSFDPKYPLKLPVISTQNSESLLKVPINSIQNPKSPRKIPAISIQNPKSPCKIPVISTQNSESLLKIPVNSIQNPKSPRKIPVNSIQNPKSPRKIPVNSTHNSKSLLKVPVNSIQNPKSPRKIPVNSIQNPKSPCKIPVNSIQNPKSPHKIPVNSTHNSKSLLKVPVNSIQNPKSPRKIPVNSIQNPKSPCKIPVHSIQNSKSPCKIPVNSTQNLKSPLKLTNTPTQNTKILMKDPKSSSKTPKCPPSISKKLNKNYKSPYNFPSSSKPQFKRTCKKLSPKKLQFQKTLEKVLKKSPKLKSKPLDVIEILTTIHSPTFPMTFTVHFDNPTPPINQYSTTLLIKHPGNKVKRMSINKNTTYVSSVKFEVNQTEPSQPSFKIHNDFTSEVPVNSN